MNKGFTFIETAISIAILLAIMGVIATSIVLIYRHYSHDWNQIIAVNEARQSVNLMTKEIREARTGDDGSYFIEKAGDKEFIFYSDIDDDNQVERVRYFISTINSGSQAKECVVYQRGGICSINFSNFLSGNLISAQIRISLEGDLGASNEYGTITADGENLGSICASGCTDCAETWQGVSTYDITSLASDNSINFVADASFRVDPQCNWEDPNHAMKARFELSWTEEIIGSGNEFKKGVIEPTSIPVSYPASQEKITLITQYNRNSPPIFEYFDVSGNKIEDVSSRVKDINLIKIFLSIDVDPNGPPEPFNIESYVCPRNVKNQQ